METLDLNQPVNIHEAKTNFSKLVAAAERGETIVISRYGKPVAQLEAVQPDPKPKKRILGGMEGAINMSWEDFEKLSKDLDEEILKNFEGAIEKPLL